MSEVLVVEAAAAKEVDMLQAAEESKLCEIVASPDSISPSIIVSSTS